MKTTSSQKRSPTIYDVAKLSGVSISTISRVLNSPDKVNSETHKRVMEAIDRLGFVPRAAARAHAMQSTNRIGVLTPFFTAPSFVQRFRGVASTLSKANYELVIYPVETIDQLRGYISSIPLMKNIDGLIIMSLAVNDQDAERLSNNGMATVLIEYMHPQLNSILINDELGGRMAAECFIRKGYKDFAFLGDIEPPERFAIHPVRSRLAGFKQVLQEAGLSLSQNSIRSAPYTQEETKQAARELLRSPKSPTAMFVASDIQALSVLQVARQMNIKVPEEFAVIGFDDIDVAEHVDLTTIRQHLDESGRLAAEILLARINEPNRPLQHINLNLNLIERLTT
jgi:DNA-binding LacI/PurR family transcriptional regulator